MKDLILTTALSLGIVWGSAHWSSSAVGQQPTLADHVARAVPEAETEPVAKAVPVRAATPAALTTRATATGTPAVAALVATLQLNAGNTQLRGQLLSEAQIFMKTSFGDATVPLSEVAGIKLASQENPATTVILHNGDSITGACDLERVDLQTEWGRAEVQRTAINSILFVENVSWVSEKGLNGTRWDLLAKPRDASAHEYKVGDRIVVARNAELKTAEGAVRAVNQGEVLTVGRVDREYLWVKTRDNKRAGWLKSSDALPAEKADAVKSATVSRHR
jgi:hypothetical protein